MLLQGLDPKYTLILVDGQRVSGRVNGRIDLTRLPADDIERIEIVRGPGSVLYGADSLAGTINIITRRASKRWEAEAHSAYGSFNTIDLTGRVGHRGDRYSVRSRPACTTPMDGTRTPPTRAPRVRAHDSSKRARRNASRPRACSRSTAGPSTSREPRGAWTPSTPAPYSTASIAAKRSRRTSPRRRTGTTEPSASPRATACSAISSSTINAGRMLSMIRKTRSTTSRRAPRH